MNIEKEGRVKVEIGREIIVPPEADYLLQACTDLTSAASETNTRYLVVGSVASVCVVGEFYRIPGDVDCWYDFANRDSFRKVLIEKGYSRSVIDVRGNLFPNPLERYEKAGGVIEARAANYTERGIEYPIRIPVPGLRVDKKPVCQLIYPPSFAEPQKNFLGKTMIKTAKKEALWIGLNSTLPLMQVAGAAGEKRLLDQEKLSDGLDDKLVEQMLSEEPGLYFGDKPVATTDKQGLLKLLLLGVKIKRSISKQ